jgi:hypothetical protein
MENRKQKTENTSGHTGIRDFFDRDFFDRDFLWEGPF